MTKFSRRSFLQATGLGVTALTAPVGMPAIIRSAHAATGTVKLGCLFSSSGTMANIEGRLNHVVRMAAEEINAKGGINGRTIEVAVSDPASDWPLYAQVGKQMLEKSRGPFRLLDLGVPQDRVAGGRTGQRSVVLSASLRGRRELKERRLCELAARQLGAAGG